MDLCKLSAELDALLSAAANFDAVAIATTTVTFHDFYWRVQIEYTGRIEKMFFTQDFETVHDVSRFFEMATIGAAVASGVEL